MTDRNRIAAPAQTLEDLRARLLQIRRTAPPKVAAFADWALTHPQEIAFNSVRGLAELASVNSNTVVRLSQTLGFTGYDPCRRAFQEALRQDTMGYGARAAQIRGAASAGLFDDMHAAARTNIDGVFDPPMRARIGEAAQMLMDAPQAYVVGVRSCYSLAHYLRYAGGMAFDNFVRRFSDPGDIFDLMARARAGDVLVAITFAHYSVETLRAHDLARKRGLRIIAITDDIRSPIAEGADIVLIPRMDGPQPMPSLIAAFALIEALIAAMVSRSDTATATIKAFEDALLDCGAYTAEGTP